MRLWTLNDQGKPERVVDSATWTANVRRVSFTRINRRICVSTVFLGIDHNVSGEGLPVLWETMVFEKGEGQHQVRCSGSIEQAEEMHERVCSQVYQAMSQKWNRWINWLLFALLVGGLIAGAILSAPS